jgi:hypothetical protein
MEKQTEANQAMVDMEALMLPPLQTNQNRKQGLCYFRLASNVEQQLSQRRYCWWKLPAVVELLLRQLARLKQPHQQRVQFHGHPDDVYVSNICCRNAFDTGRSNLRFRRPVDAEAVQSFGVHYQLTSKFVPLHCCLPTTTTTCDGAAAVAAAGDGDNDDDDARDDAEIVAADAEGTSFDVMRSTQSTKR